MPCTGVKHAASDELGPGVQPPVMNDAAESEMEKNGDGRCRPHVKWLREHRPARRALNTAQNVHDSRDHDHDGELDMSRQRFSGLGVSEHRGMLRVNGDSYDFETGELYC
jgi:hypothetical protein